MTQNTYDRLTRYAIFSAAHGMVFVAAAVGVFGNRYHGLLLVSSLPLLWAWGAFQGDVALNPHLDETDRNRWRVALWILPWAMTVYWHRYVRRQFVP